MGGCEGSVIWACIIGEAEKKRSTGPRDQRSVEQLLRLDTFSPWPRVPWCCFWLETGFGWVGLNDWMVMTHIIAHVDFWAKGIGEVEWSFF